jgi:5S rRNA maturation endonuclease (ribonuclease M5)
MLDTVQKEVLNLLPAKRKHTNKWTSFNAPCCVHRGESADRRGRGGIATGADGVITYHCFNCNFKTSYRPGRLLGFRFKQLLEWLGASDTTIQRLNIEALRLRDMIAPPEAVEKRVQETTFAPRDLPPDCTSFAHWRTFLPLTDETFVVPRSLNDGVVYINERDRTLIDRYEIYVTEDSAHNMNRRVIVPFTLKDEIIGYTARAIDPDIKPKYFTNHEPNYVFNIDKQKPASAFVIVTEGPFDAMAVDGIAILGNEISDEQVDIVNSLKREVIILPDWDEAGQKMIDSALENDWTVSFPVWRETCKDAAEAVSKYGRLFVLKSILDGRQSNGLKIELLRKKLYN